MTFNADESEYIVSKLRSIAVQDRPTFSISGQVIDYISRWPHLGNIISENEEDYNCIAARRIQLIGQVNNILSTFGKLYPYTNNRLLYKFCSSLYGSVICNMEFVTHRNKPRLHFMASYSKEDLAASTKFSLW